jgi:hypothetical protein
MSSYRMKMISISLETMILSSMSTRAAQSFKKVVLYKEQKKMMKKWSLDQSSLAVHSYLEL